MNHFEEKNENMKVSQILKYYITISFLLLKFYLQLILTFLLNFVWHLK